MPSKPKWKPELKHDIEDTAPFRALCCAVAVNCEQITASMRVISPDLDAATVKAAVVCAAGQLDRLGEIRSAQFEAIYRLVAAVTLRHVWRVSPHIVEKHGAICIDQVTITAIEQATEPGFTDAMRAAGWVSFDEATLIILRPEYFFDQSFRVEAKRKQNNIKTAERMRRYRARKAGRPEQKPDVTPEKRNDKPRYAPKSVTPTPVTMLERNGYAENGPTETQQGKDLQQIERNVTKSKAQILIESVEAPNWLLIEGQFITKVWNKLPGGRGHVAKFSHTSLPPANGMQAQFREIWLSETLKARMAQAIDKLREGLPNGNIISLKNFLTPGTIDGICDGVYDFKQKGGLTQKKLVDELGDWAAGEDDFEFEKF